MTLRRPLIAALAAGALATTMVTSGAQASPEPGERATANAGPTCRTAVIGFNGSERLVERVVKNRQITSQKTSHPFRAGVKSLIGGAITMNESVERRIFYSFTGAETGSRKLVVIDDPNKPELRVGNLFFYDEGIQAQPVAGSGSYYAYGYHRGSLYQWVRYEHTNPTWHLYGSKKLVRTKVPQLRTLSFSAAYRIGSKKLDFLFGTTKSGALVQFQIPWAHPNRAKMTVVAPRGFKKTTGISLSFCNNRTDYVSLIALDRYGNLARWYTLKNTFAPRAANLTYRGLVGQGASWRLHAVL